MPGPVFNAEPQLKPRAEIVMIALAAVGIGILAGIWVAGPALTGSGTSNLASDPVMRWVPQTYGEMMRPDPSPYRQAHAQSETSGQGARDD